MESPLLVPLNFALIALRFGIAQKKMKSKYKLIMKHLKFSLLRMSSKQIKEENKITIMTMLGAEPWENDQKL